MAGEGTDFTINIDAPADSALSAASAIDRLAAAIDIAKASSEAAEVALAAGETAYARAVAAADKAAKAVERLGQQADAQRGKLAAAMEVGDIAGAARAAAKLEDLNRKQADATAKATAATAAMNAEAASLDKLRAAAAGAGNSQAALSKQMEQARAKTAALAKSAGSGKVNEIAEGLGKLGGPLGTAGQKVFGLADGFNKLGASLGSAGPYVAMAVALVAIAAGAAAAAAGIIAATAAVLKFAVANADAARTARLLEEQAKGGAAGLAATQKLTLSLDAQTKRLKDNVGKIFSVGEKPLERFLTALSKLGDLFDENTASGNAIKVVFQSLFNPLLDGITELIPKLVAGFIQFEILVLKALIRIKPFGSTILEVAKYAGILAAVVAGALAVGISAWIAGFTLLAAVAAGVIAAVVGLVAGILYVGSLFASFGAAIYSGVGAGLAWLSAKFDETLAWLSSLSLSQIGTDLILGLVDGIMGSAQAVVGAITGVVNGAIGAAKSALGIASPSKVFAEIGMNTAAGMAGGVDDGTEQVQGSLESLVAPPAAAGGAPVTAAGGDSTAISTSTTGGATYIVTIQGGGSAEANRDAFIAWFESIGATAGAAGA